MKRSLSVAAMYCAMSAGAALAQTTTTPLPALGADLERTTVSGISSGGFMAAQIATAYSSRVKGVGVVAAGPYYCSHTYQALNSLENAENTCMTPLTAAVGANAGISFKNARAFAQGGRIDPVENLARQRVYAFSGANDDTVKTIVVDQVEQYYRLAGTPVAGIRYVRNKEAGHAFATDDPDDLPCAATHSPYINNCGLAQAHDLLRHLYPERDKPAAKGEPGGKLLRFDQKEFVAGSRSSMDDEGWLYVPADCVKGGCAVHVAFHGCLQGASEIGSRFYRHVGYNSYADANRLVVLYPQVHRSKGIPFNPQGCWDFWGYSNGSQDASAFATREAPQMKAVMAMVERLGRQP